MIALVLLGFDELNEFRFFDPPDCAFAIAHDDFGPQLIAVARKRIDVDCPAADRPETSVAGLITEIRVGIDAAGEHALARHIDHILLVGRKIAIDGAGQERLDARDLGATDSIELGNLDDPNAAHLLGGVLAADLGELIGEPVCAGEHLDRTRLLTALRTFENQHVIDLDAGCMMRATPEIIHRKPTARLSGVSSAPR